jgi:DNA-binding transcriptional ArsR family regulator
MRILYDMPRRRSRRIYKRMDAILSLVRKNGCMTMSQVVDALSLSHSHVYYASKDMANAGMISMMVIGKTAVLCADEDRAKRYIDEIAKMVRDIACRSGAKFIWPSKLLDMMDIKERRKIEQYMGINGQRITGRKGYIPLVLAFIGAIMRRIYGNPQRYRDHHVYITNCNKKLKAGHA